MTSDLHWILVHGGTCFFGDRDRRRRVKTLCWTVSPLTWRQSGRPHESLLAEHPLSNIDFSSAVSIAAALGSRLPTTVEWEWMAAGESQRMYPWGDDDWTPELANLRPAGMQSTTRIGQFHGRTPEGLLDVAGNVWEWTATTLLGHAAIIRGGSYSSEVIHARSKFINAAPAELASPGLGVRLVRDT